MATVTSKPTSSSVQSVHTKPSTTPKQVQAGSIKLFGQIIHPSKSVQHTPKLLKAPMIDTHTTNLPSSRSPPSPINTLRTPKWVVENVQSVHRSKYVALLERLKISTNRWVSTKLLRTLKAQERKAIEEENDVGIQRIIEDRPHLVRYAPLEYPEHIRPKGERLKYVEQARRNRWNKIKSWINRDARWDTQHTTEDAKKIRDMVIQLHKADKWDKNWNRKIKAVSPEDRVKALQGDSKAQYELGPKFERGTRKRIHMDMEGGTSTSSQQKHRKIGQHSKAL